MSRPAAYKGNDPYIFVSYCHKDDARVWPMIEGLQARGLRVWYDEGIEWGSHWDEVIFEHLSGCACVVAFVTNSFLQSENCKDEISYAKDEQKGPFIVFLDNLELTGMMKYRYGRLQALNLHQFDDVDALLDTLAATQTLSACRGVTNQPAVQPTAPASKHAPQQTVSMYQPSRSSDADLKEWNRKGDECYDKQEYAEAVKWYRKAAEQGHTTAQYMLGCCYYSGKGVAKDAAEEVKWWRKAAERGHKIAQNNLAVCYEDGTGVPKDKAEALKWYRKAAEQGHARAQYKVGEYYASGTVVSRDYCEAVKWYRKAADQGDMWGAFYLADCYAHGRGVPKDKTEALKWFQVADKHGHPWAKEQIEQLSWY